MTTRDKVERGLADFQARMDANVKRTGRSVIGVFADPEHGEPAFSYSIGNHLKGLPELLVIGMYDDGNLINVLSSRMLKRGRKFDDGEIIDLGGSVPICVLDASDEVRHRYTIQAGAYFGLDEDYAVMQIVVPDKKGLFPWDPDCAAPYSQVPIYRRNVS